MSLHVVNIKKRVQEEKELLKLKKYHHISEGTALKYAAKGLPIISGVIGCLGENFIMGSYAPNWIPNLYQYCSKQKPSINLDEYPEIFIPAHLDQIKLLVEHYSIPIAYQFILQIIPEKSQKTK